MARIIGAPGRASAAGVIAGVMCQHVFCSTGSITADSTTVPVLLGDQGGAALAAMNNPTGAAVYVDSSSADDGYDQNKGLEYAYLHGFDINKNYVVDTVIPHGTTGTASPITNWRSVFWMDPKSFGATVKCVGNCFIQDDAAGTTKYLAISANGVKGSHCWITIPDNVILAVEILAWSTISTTATDSVRIVVTDTRDAVARTIHDVTGEAPGAALKNCIIDYKFVYDPIEWTTIKFAGLKVGTTNQVINYNIKWGFRFK